MIAAGKRRKSELMPSSLSSHLILTTLCLSVVGCTRPQGGAHSAPLPEPASAAKTVQTAPASQAAQPAPEPVTQEPAPEPLKFLDQPLFPTSCPAPGEPTPPPERARDQLRVKFDPAQETRLLEPEHVERARAYGAWDATSASLLPPAAGPAGMSSPPRFLWVSGAGEAGDGLVRARFAVDGALDYELLLRARLDASAQRVEQGLSVTFQGAEVWISRYEAGEPAIISPKETLYKLAYRDTIEVLAYMIGDRVHVQVHDAYNGVELVTLSVEGELPARGEVAIGAPAEHKNSRGSHLTLLSHRELCGVATPPMSPWRPPRAFVALTDSQWARLPPTVLTHLSPFDQRPDGIKEYETDGVGLEALHCAGMRPVSSSAEIPWKALDARYLAYKHQPPVRDEQGLRVDLSYKSPGMVSDLLRAFHERYPQHTRLEEIGTSTQGRPIWALAIARDIKADDPRPAILLNAAHHGDEPTSTEIALDAIKVLLSERDKDVRDARWLSSLVIWVVPQVNPDGALAFLEQSYRAGRKNGRDANQDGVLLRGDGVDLNRNYPFRWHTLGEEGSSSEPTSSYYRGAAAGSEPETRAMMQLAERERFAAAISYHTGTVCILAPYTIDGVENPEPNEAWEVGREISRAMPRHPEGRGFRLKKNLYPVDGTDQDWLRAEHGTLALLVEAVRRTPRDHCERASVIEANRASWMLLLNRLLDGPALTGRVLDEQGQPVQGAIVRLKAQTLKAGERWGTRKRDGRFTRFLTKRGVHEVEVEAPGFATQTERVEVGRRAPLVERDIVLKRVSAQ